jgi:hypothetical protein
MSLRQILKVKAFYRTERFLLHWQQMFSGGTGYPPHGGTDTFFKGRVTTNKNNCSSLGFLELHPSIHSGDRT